MCVEHISLMLRDLLFCQLQDGSSWLGDAALSTWKYRVILKDGKYAIHEVFYGEEGAPWTCTEEPVCPEGDTLEALREELEHYQRALELPVLEYANLVPDYTPSGIDTEEAF